MKRNLVKLSKVFAALCALGVLGGLSLSSSTASAQEEIVPPPDFLATTTPVYYEGHPAYWYGNRWVYRDGGRWTGYRSEPAYLHGLRGQAGWGARYHYGNGGFRGAHGGGRR